MNIEICLDNTTQREFKGKSMLEKLSDYVVIDLETTGKSIYKCEIIELSAVRVRNNEITQKFSSLVRPSVNIPYEIVKLTGITDEMVSDKPTIDEVLEEYIDFLGNDILLGHNISSYDVNILYDTYERLFEKTLNNDYLDTLRFARYCDINTDNLKLNTIAAYYDIVNEQAHRSLSDCITNHYVYQKMKETFSPSAKARKTGSRKFIVKSTAETKAIRELQEALQYVLDNNNLTPGNVYLIDNWLEEHSEFKSKYPFNEIYNSIENVMADGIIEDTELEYLKSLFHVVLNPVSAQEHISDVINIKNSKICLTGDFVRGSRAKIIELFESKGAKISASVSSKTNYVVVGDLGSENWQCGNYGSKIKKALELQQSGKNVEIYNEKEFFEKIGD